MENKLVPIEHNGVRVITTELLAQVYETDTNNIKNNFNNHKDNFREGVHYQTASGGPRGGRGAHQDGGQLPQPDRAGQHQ